MFIRLATGLLPYLRLQVTLDKRHDVCGGRTNDVLKDQLNTIFIFLIKVKSEVERIVLKI